MTIAASEVFSSMLLNDEKRAENERCKNQGKIKKLEVSDHQSSIEIMKKKQEVVAFKKN